MNSFLFLSRFSASLKTLHSKFFRFAYKSLLNIFSVLLNYIMWSSNHFSISNCFLCFLGSRFFRVQVFQGVGLGFRSSSCKEETLAQLFSDEFWEISKNTFFKENLRCLLLSTTISHINYWDQVNSWKNLWKFWNGPLCRNKSGPSPLLNVAVYWQSSDTKLVSRNCLRYLQTTLIMGGGGLVSEFMWGIV